VSLFVPHSRSRPHGLQCCQRLLVWAVAAARMFFRSLSNVSGDVKSQSNESNFYASFSIESELVHGGRVGAFFPFFRWIEIYSITMANIGLSCCRF